MMMIYTFLTGNTTYQCAVGDWSTLCYKCSTSISDTQL